ncbi:MAG: hypothetical protein JXB35_09875 [Anaerolineae bacterium]|nr:hypothetical protein [Anaerolineae bacterium]
MQNRRSTEVIAEFFAHGYRVSGSFDARQRTLGDMIYDINTSYLTVENAYVSSIQQPGEISINYPIAVINKTDLTFVLTIETEDALRRDQRYGSYLGLKLTPIFITLPFFELKGFLRMPGRFDPLVLLSSGSERFVTLVDVTARTTFDSEISFQGGAALVNKPQISFVGLEKL